MNSRRRVVLGLVAGLLSAALVLVMFLIRAARAGQEAFAMAGPTPAERRRAEDTGQDIWNALLERESRPSEGAAGDRRAAGDPAAGR